MKLLVVGCSFSSGWGFDKEKDNPDIWPNLLNADVTNLSVTGTDNTGIFLNTLLADPDKFDCVVVQWTGLDRVILGHSMINYDNPLPTLPDAEYRQFYKSFLLLNKRLHHLTRFCQMITYLQKYKNIYFVNGLLDWNKDVFDINRPWYKVADNKFLRSVVDVDQLTDNQIQEVWAGLKNQLSNIDLTRWINPFKSMQSIRSDQISDVDLHPGILSHQQYAELIRNKICR